MRTLPCGTELEDLVSLAVLAARVGDPEVAVAIDGRAVGEDEHPLSPGRQDLPVGVVLEDRRFAASRAGVLEAAMNDVDRPVGRGLDRGDRRPCHTRRELTPVARRPVRLREIVSGRLRLGAQRRRTEASPRISPECVVEPPCPPASARPASVTPAEDEGNSRPMNWFRRHKRGIPRSGRQAPIARQAMTPSGLSIAPGKSASGNLSARPGVLGAGRLGRNSR